jgi:hypothetical protein
MVIAPIAVLGMFQITFLPYHSISITSWHRLILIADLLAICVFCPIEISGPLRNSRRLKRLWLVLASLGFASVSITAISLFVATIPHERLDQWLLERSFIELLDYPAREAAYSAWPVHRLGLEKPMVPLVWFGYPPGFSLKGTTTRRSNH